jgi:hypothetical protein
MLISELSDLLFRVIIVEYCSTQLSIAAYTVMSAQGQTLNNKMNTMTYMFVCIWTRKSIKILMHTRSLFQVTNFLPCNWLNTCILHLYICTAVIWLAITTLSFDNHLHEDSHCIPKHVGVSYHPCFVNGADFLFDIQWVVPSLQNRCNTFISYCLYCCAFVGINIVH